MELRQIIRDQKLKSFNLVSLVKEESDYEEFISNEIPGLRGTEVKIGTALDYDNDADFGKRPDKTRIYIAALATIHKAMGDKKDKLKGVPQDVKQDIIAAKANKPYPEEQPTADSEDPEITQADDDSDVTTAVAQHTQEPDKEAGEEETAAKKAGEEAETRKAPDVLEGPETKEQINEGLDYIEDVTGKNKRIKREIKGSGR